MHRHARVLICSFLAPQLFLAGLGLLALALQAPEREDRFSSEMETFFRTSPGNFEEELCKEKTRGKTYEHQN
jgi:hypothetical protein